MREEDGSGLLVPPADPDALADALLRVLATKALRGDLAARALAASRRFDVRTSVDAMQALYDELLAGGAPGR